VTLLDHVLAIKAGVSNSFVGAGHTARYHSVDGPHCFRGEKCSK